MKFKRYQSLLIVCLLVLCGFCFSSCREDPATTRLLQEAEAALDSVPQKAYTLLKNADSVAVFSTAQRAEWNLLITQAMDKIKEKPANDSIIRQAVDYYAQKEDPHRQMLSYYYWGRVTHTLGDALRAQDYYLKAREKAIRIQNAPYLARINSNIGILYLYQELPEEALPYLLETEKDLTVLNDNVNLRFATRNLGRVYDMLNKPDSALSYYKKALSYATLPKQQVLLLNEIIPLYINQAEYDSAFACVQEIQKLSGHKLTLQSSLVVGQYFAHTNQPDLANLYLKECLEAPQVRLRATAHYHLYQMAREKQDLKNYTLHQTQYEILRDSIRDNVYAEKLLHLQKLYDYEKKENEIKQMKLIHAGEKQKRILLGSAVLLLALVFLFYIYRMQIRKKEWEEQRLRWELLLEEQGDVLDLDEQIIISPLYQKLYDPMNKKITKEEILEFTHLIDTYHPGFLKWIKRLTPGLEERNIFICYFSKANIPPKSVAIILDMKESNVSNTRARLAKRLFGKEEKAKIFDQEIKKIN
ncbi:tetratricopeptide repeat protein [Parabacteroides sp. PF5-6]|uniref:tetratricopeptide repeat protein n=1 Tax=Parabacteroides sp. PF5-6 TaxID=1742403 RepID=UPI0024072D38|nr:tetratricopeptide repeat protein [Parabacteroides sp. PF5-6]MDF9831106.1 hypothetical protein [Parabacteroides sp. PF5-6]